MLKLKCKLEGKNGIYDDQCTVSKFLNLLDVVSGALPHSNKAAEWARTQAFCLQAQLRLAAVFLSITPDDYLSLYRK
jgi:hypothetical protein